MTSRGKPRLLASVLITAEAAVLGLLGTAAAPADAASAATSHHNMLHFGQCPAASVAPPGVYCAKLKVPLDYAHPSGTQITLEVSAVGDGGAAHAMIVNPGGPGAPGIGTENYVWTKLPESVADRDEVFSFDPRGVGASTPLRCGTQPIIISDLSSPWKPKSRAIESARLAQAKKVADGCYAHSRALLRTLTVANEARDMDRIRQAIGKPTIDYLGYSGGTGLGAIYATLFPQHVGRMVLDSVEDPTVNEYRASYEQDPAFQTRIEQFFSWVAAHNTKYGLGATRSAVTKTWNSVRTKLDAHPAGKQVSSAGLDVLLGGAMYLSSEWPDVASLVTDYRAGDANTLVRAAESANQGSLDIGQLAYTCTDPGWPTRWSTWRADTTKAAKASPYIAWLNTWTSAPCLYWHVRTEPAITIGSVRTPPILLIDTHYDPATPIIGARRMHAALRKSQLLISGGGDHAAYLTDPNTCIDTAANNYWLKGALPSDGICPVSTGDH